MNDNNGTLKVKGKCQGESLLVLLDSGSTFSFVDSAMVHSMGIEPETIPSVVVTIANSDKMSSNE